MLQTTYRVHRASGQHKGLTTMSKQKSVTKVVAPVAPVAVANTPVAPVNGSQGKASPGGHVKAWRSQAAFSDNATIALLSTTNPWRPNTPGHAFWAKCLAVSPAPSTVGAAMQL